MYILCYIVHIILYYFLGYAALCIQPEITLHSTRINVTSVTGYTPLIAASYGGHVAVVEELLSHGADVQARDSSSTQAIVVSHRYQCFIRLFSQIYYSV